MKCKNCGINFDDGERVCPMCGTPAGAGQGRAIPHYTDYNHTDHTGGSCTHRTFTKKYSSAASPLSPRKTSFKTASVIVAAIVAVVLISFIPMLLNASSAGGAYGHYADAPEPAAENLPPAQDESDFAANRVAPLDVLSGYQEVDTGAGEFILTFDGEDNYTFAFEGDGWRYDESGWAWCVYNPPEQELYEDIYTPDLYDSYTLCLDFEQTGDAGGAQPKAMAAHIEQGEMWVLVYVSQTDGSVVLDDAYGDAAAFFGGEQFLPLQAIEKG